MKDVTIVPNDFIITHRKTDFAEEVTKDNEVRYAVERKYTELVHCKDCKYWVDDMSGNMWCEHAIGGLTEPTDFCSRGERRADEIDDRFLADK